MGTYSESNESTDRQLRASSSTTRSRRGIITPSFGLLGCCSARSPPDFHFFASDSRSPFRHSSCFERSATSVASFFSTTFSSASREFLCIISIGTCKTSTSLRGPRILTRSLSSSTPNTSPPSPNRKYVPSTPPTPKPTPPQLPIPPTTSETSHTPHDYTYSNTSPLP